MEGVGARLGRSSTRYGPTVVFSGPVRKWKKRWTHVSAPNSSQQQQPNPRHSRDTNGTSNGARLMLYKWTPVGNGKEEDGENGDADVDERPRRRVKYIPVALLEEQKNETAEQTDEEVIAVENDSDAGEPTSKSNGIDEKPDINDVPMDENQALEGSPVERQDLNESTLDLSLG